MAHSPLKIDYSSGTPRISDANVDHPKNLPFSKSAGDWDDLEGNIDVSVLRAILNRMPKDSLVRQVLSVDETLTEDDRGKEYYVVTSNKVTLPDSPPIGWKCLVGIGNIGITIGVETQGTNRFVLPGTNPGSVVPTRVEGTLYGQVAWFKYVGTDFWSLEDGNGLWTATAGTGTPATYKFDGHVTGGTSGNLVSRDGSGSIQDSGSKSADFEAAIGAKGDAFNKNFGTGSGDVCEGDDSRLGDAREMIVVTASSEPTLTDGQTRIWINSGDSDRTYVLHRRTSDSVQVKVELT